MGASRILGFWQEFRFFRRKSRIRSVGRGCLNLQNFLAKTSILSIVNRQIYVQTGDFCDFCDFGGKSAFGWPCPHTRAPSFTTQWGARREVSNE